MRGAGSAHNVAEFGNQVHPVMKTITTNTGIDISTKEDTPVRCIADGEIALIHWLPSYGNLIIINHSHGYRTVYAHLSEISVVAGQQIKEGSVIARSGETVFAHALGTKMPGANPNGDRRRRWEHYTVTPREAMLELLAVLRERHGSVEKYLASIGVTAEHVRSMREHLLTA